MITKSLFRQLCLTALVAFVPLWASAQVTIGASTQPAATLDVVAEGTVPAGVIPPRVNRAALNGSAHGTAQTGAIVYVNALGGTATGTTVNVTSVGFYYFNGTVWQPLGGGGGGVLAPPNIIFNGTLTAATQVFAASQFTAQQSVIIHWGGPTTGLTLRLPNLSSADIGKTVLVINRGTGGTLQGELTLIDQATGNPMLNNFPAAIGSNRARTFMWLGNVWTEISA